MGGRLVQIVNQRGLHARAAAKFVTVAERFAAEVDVEFDGRTVAAASIMGLMMLGAGIGATLSLTGRGDEADAAVDALVKLVEAGFNEAE